MLLLDQCISSYKTEEKKNNHKTLRFKSIQLNWKTSQGPATVFVGIRIIRPFDFLCVNCVVLSIYNVFCLLPP